MSLARTAALTLANLKMLVRNRGALFFALAFPLIFMVIFGLIFGNAENQRTSLGVSGGGPLVQALSTSQAVKLRPAATPSEAIRRVKDGKETGALVTDGPGRVARLYVSNTSLVQAATLRGIVQGVADAVNLQATGQPPLVTVQQQSVDSRSLKYIDFLVPGLLAMALSQSAVFGVAAALVSFRERGIFRRLRVTPLPIAEFAVARLLSSLLLALAQTVVLLAVGRLAFGVHLGGELAGLVPLVVLGALCFIAIGFLVGSLTSTQDGAAAVGNIVTLPMVFLAGVFFPLDSAPGWLQAVSRYLPLTYLADGLRDVAIRGHSVGATAGDLVVLGGVAAGVALVALRAFRWEPRH